MDSITEKEVKLFCRYASDIHVERGTCIADEYDPKMSNANEIGNKLIQIKSFLFFIYYRLLELIYFIKKISAQKLEDSDNMLVYYVVLRGIEKFQFEFNSYPGEFDDHVEPDIIKLKVTFSFYQII